MLHLLLILTQRYVSVPVRDPPVPPGPTQAGGGPGRALAECRLSPLRRRPGLHQPQPPSPVPRPAAAAQPPLGERPRQPHRATGSPRRGPAADAAGLPRRYQPGGASACVPAGLPAAAAELWWPPGLGAAGDSRGLGAAPDTSLSAGSVQTWPLISTAPSWLTVSPVFPQTPPSTPGGSVPPALPQSLPPPLPFTMSPVPSGPSSPLSSSVTSTPWSPTSPLLSLANVFSLAVMSAAHTLLPAVSSIASSGGPLYPPLLPRPQNLVLGPPRFAYPDPASMAKPAPACGGIQGSVGSDVSAAGGALPFPPPAPAPPCPAGSEAAGSPWPSPSTSRPGSPEGSTVSAGVAGAPWGC